MSGEAAAGSEGGLTALPLQPPLPAIVRGHGESVVLFHGYGLAPQVYRGTIDLLAERCRVLAPYWLAVHGRWTYERALGALLATIEEHEVRRAHFVAHSYGGGLAVGLAARHPHRVRSLVLADSIALSERVRLARAMPGSHLLRMASARSAFYWVRSWLGHPVDMLRMSWWGFSSSKSAEIDAVVEAEIRCHVLWAETDSLLSHEEGERFAKRLGCSLTRVHNPDGAGPIDHDWMFAWPALFVAALAEVGVPSGAPVEDGRLDTDTERW